MPADCIFCRIADQEIPADVVYHDEVITAFRDIKPAAPVHILIIPNMHIPDVLHLEETQAGLFGKMVLVAARLARAEGIDESGFRLVVNNGPAAGQAVPHLHLHLLGGRDLGWPPG